MVAHHDLPKRNQRRPFSRRKGIISVSIALLVCACLSSESSETPRKPSNFSELVIGGHALNACVSPILNIQAVNGNTRTARQTFEYGKTVWLDSGTYKIHYFCRRAQNDTGSCLAEIDPEMPPRTLKFELIKGERYILSCTSEGMAALSHRL